jgi:hypothetical protein
MISISKLDINSSGQGYLYIIYPFQKDQVLKVLEEMQLIHECDDQDCIEYYVTEDPEKFLTLYRNTTFTKNTFCRALIDEAQGTITFITRWGFLLGVSNKLQFSIDSGIYNFITNSERYEIYFVPARYRSELYMKYTGIVYEKDAKEEGE